jgi:hypothetical protein
MQIDALTVDSIGVSNSGTAVSFASDTLGNMLGSASLASGWTVSIPAGAVYTQPQLPAGATFAGLVRAAGQGGWTSNNFGRQLYVTTPTPNANTPCIGISDATATYNIAIAAGQNTVYLFGMPALSNNTTPQTLLASFANNGCSFNGAAFQAKPTVTGAKGGNVALGSLLSALAAYGLVTDSTTA